MKRFQSPLQKIQRLQHQQLRLAEMALLQAQQRVADCQRQIQHLRDAAIEEQESIRSSFQTQNTTVSFESLKSTFALQQLTAERTRRELTNLEECHEQVRVAEKHFKELKARCQGTDDLLQKQINEHRLDSFRKQQVDLEDGARAVSFLNHRATERKVQS